MTTAPGLPRLLRHLKLYRHPLMSMADDWTGHLVCAWFQVQVQRATLLLFQGGLKLLLNAVALNLKSVFLAPGVRNVKSRWSRGEAARHVYLVLAQGDVDGIVCRRRS